MTHLDHLITTRKSIRKYSDKPIDKSTIETLLESARLAPSAVNYQPWKFIVCASESSKKIVRESYPRAWFNQAQLYVVACGNHAQSWKRQGDGKDHCDIDVAIAVEHLVLKITDLDLATCWVCNFDADLLKKAFSLPQEMEPIAILPVGYPDENAPTDDRNQKRKALDEIAEWR